MIRARIECIVELLEQRLLARKNLPPKPRSKYVEARKVEAVTRSAQSVNANSVYKTAST